MTKPIRAAFLATAVLLTAAVHPTSSKADVDLAPVVASSVTDHVLPRIQDFARTADALNIQALSNCHASDQNLRASFHSAADSWAAMSHLRFGPTETDDRAFAIAFWPDTRGKTPKALREFLIKDDPADSEASAFAQSSIAGRGLYALEYMLFDETLAVTGTPEGRCRVIRALTNDLAVNAAAIADDWNDGFASTLMTPTPNGPYRDTNEAAKELFKALSTGLEFTAEVRLGRPLGSFDRPRPTRAEMRRSDRSLRQVSQSLEGLEELAKTLSAPVPALQLRLSEAFAAAKIIISELDDPGFADVATTSGRLKVEILQQHVNIIREIVTLELGPALGLAAGFNALDGD